MNNLINYIIPFVLTVLFIYFAITAESWFWAIMYSAIAAIDAYMFINNILRRKQ